ncbi:hypothetical protein Tco_1545960 [Tanacetum coccineum]
MTTLADKAILSGADNRPPMLEKDMYDSWKSIMELYMMNRQHGRMILESVENGPLIWPTIEENGVTRPTLSKMFRLSQEQCLNDTHMIDADYHSGMTKQPMAEVDRNTTPKLTDMSHRGGETDQNADAEKCQVSCPLPDLSFDNMTTESLFQSLESENISLRKTVSQLQKDFSRMEAHCVNMKLKYQNQALKDGKHGQILHETSNEANIKRKIYVLEIINVELESSVARLLAENVKLNKENKHLKQTYKDLSDSIKKTSVQTKDHTYSLIVQLNCKSVENADLKTQIQEKVFANAALKNKLRKLKGTSVDTK